MSVVAPPIARKLGAHAAVLGLYAVMTVGMTWPLVTRLDDGVVKDIWWHDAYTNAMILENRVQNLLGPGAGGIYESYWFAPLTDTIAFNENEFALGLMALPFSAARLAPLTTYNLVLLLSLTLAGFTMFLLARFLVRDRLAAFFAGVVFAFCPYVFSELGRLQLVAVQWIPLCFLFLHRSLTQGRTRHMIGLGCAYVLQVGTGMYYSLFILPLMLLYALWLLARRRVRRTMTVRAWARLAAVGLVTLAVVVAMVWPYLLHRGDYGLIHETDYIAEHDGELAHFLQVSIRNRTWTPLHLHMEREQIAFPGLTTMLLLLVAVAVPLARAWRADRRNRRPPRPPSLLVTWAAGFVASAVAAAVVGHGVACLPVIALVAWYWRSRGPGRLLPTSTVLHLSLLVLSVALFLGVVWYEHEGQPLIWGPYDLLRSYVPGFQSVRKASRLAILVMVPLTVLAAFGLSILLQRLRRWRRRSRWALALVCVALVLVEFRNAPVVIQPMISADQVSRVYTWLRDQPGAGTVAALPVAKGRLPFWAHVGASVHNYFMVFHRRRSVLGFSTWNHPMSEAVSGVLDAAPKVDPLPLLRLAGVRYLVVHWDYVAVMKRRELLRYFDGRRDILRPVFQAGEDIVYELQGGSKEAPRLHETPAPPGAPYRGLLPTRQWWGDDHAKLELDRRRRIAAFDVRFMRPLLGTPTTYAVDVSDDGQSWRTVIEQRRPLAFKDQLYRPGRFIFRVVLSRPASARHLRLRVLGEPPAYFSIVQKVLVWAD